jgi:hypothetical protein
MRDPDALDVNFKPLSCLSNDSLARDTIAAFILRKSHYDPASRLAQNGYQFAQGYGCAASETKIGSWPLLLRGVASFPTNWTAPPPSHRLQYMVKATVLTG